MFIYNSSSDFCFHVLTFFSVVLCVSLTSSQPLQQPDPDVLVLRRDTLHGERSGSIGGKDKLPQQFTDNISVASEDVGLRARETSPCWTTR